METQDNNKKWALISALLYAGLALYYGINIVLYLSNGLSEYISTYQVVNTIGASVMAAGLVSKNKRALAAAAGVNVFCNLWHAAYYIIAPHTFDFFFVSSLFYTMAYAALVTVIIWSIKENRNVTKFWFGSGVLYLIGGLFCYFQGFFIDNLLFPAVEGIALILVGLWLKAPFELIAPPQMNGYVSFDQSTVNGAYKASANGLGGADRLKTFKELLDSGIITQEEFDQKKKEILGL